MRARKPSKQNLVIVRVSNKRLTTVPLVKHLRHCIARRVNVLKGKEKGRTICVGCHIDSETAMQK